MDVWNEQSQECYSRKTFAWQVYFKRGCKSLPNTYCPWSPLIAAMASPEHSCAKYYQLWKWTTFALAPRKPPALADNAFLSSFLSCLTPEARLGWLWKEGRPGMQRGLAYALFTFLQLFGNYFPWCWQQALFPHATNAPLKTLGFWSLGSQQEM